MNKMMMMISIDVMIPDRNIIFPTSSIELNRFYRHLYNRGTYIPLRFILSMYLSLHLDRNKHTHTIPQEFFIKN